jgi:glycosyltransferase involved in cell wall biosynthesis
MRKVLILLTSSYPFGNGEAFVANEMPYLESAFDEIIVVSNDVESGSARSLPPSVTCLRRSYELSGLEKVLAVLGGLRPAVWRELRFVGTRYRLPLGRTAVATILVSWFKARKFGRLIRDLAGQHPDAEVHAYSFWANDMALAVAYARRRGWVDRGYCRAHGWDVYFERSEAGFLPFRRFLTDSLDHYLFISEHGERYHRDRVGPPQSASVGHLALGTPSLVPRPVARRTPFVVLSCSNAVPGKRLELLAGALKHVRTALTWVHVGDGPTLNAVRAVVAELPPGIHVDLRGHLPNDEVRALYPTLRPSLFVNVSEMEGLPVSMMEAMSAGVPVLGTDVGGVSEIVSHGSNGTLLPPQTSPEDVAAAIDAFAEMPDGDYAECTQRAWATWREGFQANANYGKFLEATEAPHNLGPSPS